MHSEPPEQLAVEGLSVRFGARVVLEDLSFTVRRGEFYGLLGPNGSGKSTTMGVLTGLLRPAAGRIRFAGQPVEPGAHALRQQIGVVFQRPSLDPNLSGRENLQLAARLRRVAPDVARSRIDELLRFADLDGRADDRVKVLSGGMKRRLELARSLIHEPAMLLMDEPTTGLDEQSFQRTWARLDERRQSRGLTVLVSTHRPEEAARCDRIALIDAGRVVACDTPAALQRAVSGDVITLTGSEPERLAESLRTRFELDPRPTAHGVELIVEDGHAWIPKLVEAFPRGQITEVRLKQPTLADVFLARTGHRLDKEERD